METYLNHIKVNKYRIELSKFRLSSHKLEIETGRHRNIPRADRKFKKCNADVTQMLWKMNTTFYLFVLYTENSGKHYLKTYYYHWPTINKF